MSRGLKATAAAEKEPQAGTEDGDAIYQRGIRRKGEGGFVLRRRQGCLVPGVPRVTGVPRGRSCKRRDGLLQCNTPLHLKMPEKACYRSLLRFAGW